MGVSCDRCKDDPPFEPEFCVIDGELFNSERGRQQMMDYMYFKEGTWWVYEEENSGALDTISVYYNNDGLDTSEFDDYHWFVCQTHSTFTNYNYYYEYHESFTGHCVINEACACQRVKRTKTQPGDFVGAYRDFFSRSK